MRFCAAFLSQLSFPLRLSQVFHNDFHLLFQVAMAVFVVACGIEFFRQAGDTTYTSIDVLQGGSGFASGALERRQFRRVVSADGECFFFFFFLHYSYYDYLLFFNVNIAIKSLIVK